MAVKELSLQVNEGDVFGFLGPNGAGKTTTIRMLDGLLEPTSGTVFVNGMNVQKNPVEIKRIIGVVPESHGYYYYIYLHINYLSKDLMYFFISSIFIAPTFFATIFPSSSIKNEVGIDTILYFDATL